MHALWAVGVGPGAREAYRGVGYPHRQPWWGSWLDPNLAIGPDDKPTPWLRAMAAIDEAPEDNTWG